MRRGRGSARGLQPCRADCRCFATGSRWWAGSGARGWAAPTSRGTQRSRGPLGVYRMADSTIFSIDVAVAKARNVVYFSGPNRAADDLPGVPMGTAVTNRTIGFGAQIFYPSGIWNTQPGPFYALYQRDLATP